MIFGEGWMPTARSGFRWSTTYGVNIAALDRQHQALFDTINELNVALSAGDGNAAVEKILQKLLDYVSEHFSEEEALMVQHDFPGFSTHRAQHERFSRQVAQFLEHFQQGRPGVPVSLMLFLQSWLKGHILGCDKAYSAYLNARGVH